MAERSLFPYRNPFGLWWLSDGKGNTFGPFTDRQVRSRFGRYRGLRRCSGASRRACWKRSGEIKPRG